MYGDHLDLHGLTHSFPTRRSSDLLLGPLPVFGTEGVERHRLDTEVARRAHDGAHRLDAGLVAGDARKQALLGPAAVAVHDDSDMARAVVSYRHAKALNPVRIERSRDAPRSEERRVGKECVSSVDLGGRRIIKKKKPKKQN